MSFLFSRDLTNKRLNVLYTGVTNHLIRRVYERKNKMVEGFTKKNVDRLVHYENNSKWEDLFNAII